MSAFWIFRKTRCGPCLDRWWSTFDNTANRLVVCLFFSYSLFFPHYFLSFSPLGSLLFRSVCNLILLIQHIWQLILRSLILIPRSVLVSSLRNLLCAKSYILSSYVILYIISIDSDIQSAAQTNIFQEDMWLCHCLGYYSSILFPKGSNIRSDRKGQGDWGMQICTTSSSSRSNNLYVPVPYLAHSKCYLHQSCILYSILSYSTPQVRCDGGIVSVFD
jgi:hypothetical protein